VAVLGRLAVLAGLIAAGFVFSTAARAECGGDVQCIAVGATAAEASTNHHGGGSGTVTLDFGSVPVGTTSAAMTIFVAAVTRTDGAMAVLGQITVNPAVDFQITGGTCSTTNGPRHPSSTTAGDIGTPCTITVAFNPQTAGVKTATVDVPLNPPCAGCITGRTATVTGTGGPPVRIEPPRDPKVVGLIHAQAQTAKRFSRAQIVNFQRRMESLHRDGGGGEAVAERSAGRAGSAPAASGLLPTAFASTLVSAATTGTASLSYGSDRTAGWSGGAGGTGIWIGGNISFGTRDATDDASALRFSTDGVSVGIDRRFSERLVVGLGLGYALDRTAIGTDGTRSRSSGSSIALYGSYQPTRNTFLDGLIGYGALRHDSDRFVAAANDFARAHRRSDQLFGSLAAGYEHRAPGLLLSPYGRLDFARDRFDEATESGAGGNALTYFEQKLSALQLSLGLRAESQHETNFGWMLPRLRVELKHDFDGDRAATVAFADQVASGPFFSVTPGGVKRDALLVGVGGDFVFRQGLKLGVDYQVLRSSGTEHSQAIRVWLSKELDGKSLTAGLASAAGGYGTPVRVEAGVTRDDNVNRARDAADKRSDYLYSLSLTKGVALPVTSQTRVLVTGFANADKLRSIRGLDRVSAGAQGEFQYRASGEFAAPIFGLFGRASLEEYHSGLRSGYRTSLGLTARQAWTDRIHAFGSLAGNWRHARSDVFDARDYAARFNLDYALGQTGALYLGGEYRRGDTVSSAPAALVYTGGAKAFVADDAYGASLFNAYRYEAKTVLWTLGYNRSLGPSDSLDLSWRQAQSTPTSQSGTGGSSRYTANQVSVVYLILF